MHLQAGSNAADSYANSGRKGAPGKIRSATLTVHLILTPTPTPTGSPLLAQTCAVDPTCSDLGSHLQARPHKAQWVCDQLRGGGAEHPRCHEQPRGGCRPVRRCQLLAHDAKRRDVDAYEAVCSVHFLTTRKVGVLLPAHACKTGFSGQVTFLRSKRASITQCKQTSRKCWRRPGAQQTPLRR